MLDAWAALPHSALEGLEKLGLVEAGIPIEIFGVEADCFSVDSAAQLEQARAMLQGAG